MGTGAPYFSIRGLIFWRIRQQNGFAVAPYGPILWENGATGSRKVSGGLPGLREAINNSDTPPEGNICFFRGDE